MLVAEVAEGLGITLHVVLPYEESAYLNSFDDERQKERFFKFKTYASKVETLTCDVRLGTSKCYQILGEYLADTSNILLALWDGVDNGKSGGTSAIVKYMRQGFEVNRFDALDGNALIVVKTPRMQNPKIDEPFKVVYECLGKHIKGDEFENMLKKIDTLNEETNITTFENNSIAQTYMDYFSKKASRNQKTYKRYSLALLVLTFVAIMSMEIVHVLGLDHFIIGYGGCLLVAFGIYHFFMEKGKLQDDFVYSRGFVEALRIQNAWNHAELNESVAKYYLKNQHHKFVWVKTILKNFFYLNPKPFTLNDKVCNVQSWIEEQISYFRSKSKERHDKFEKLESIEKVLYRFGLVFVLVFFTVYLLDVYSKIEAVPKHLWSLPNIIQNAPLTCIWHKFVLVSSLLLLAAAFIGEKYVKSEGYEEDIYHFNSMLSDFLAAQKALERSRKRK